MQIIFIFIFLVFLYFVFPLWRRYTTESGAPYVPLEPDVVERIMEMTEVNKDDIFYDLGSGDGRVVIAAAMKGSKAVGIETDWFRVLYSRLWIKILRLDKQAKIIRGDIFKKDLSKATIVHTYLLQETNDMLQEKLEKELKKGTKVISSAFKFKKWKLVKKDNRGPIYGPLYVYIL